MRVYDLTSGQEKDVFTSSKSADGNRLFKCEICTITVTGKRNLETHLVGKKHLGKLGSYSIVDGSTEPVIRQAKSLLGVHDTSVLSQLLPVYRAAALVGLEFALEAWWEGERDPRYFCLLCHFQCGIVEFMYHMLSAQHRLQYLKRFFPSAYIKFARVKNRRFWEQATYDGLDFVISRIEFKFKRETPMVTDNGDQFMSDPSTLFKSAESAQHAREIPSLNFMNIADPFKSYLNRIPRHQIS